MSSFRGVAGSASPGSLGEVSNVREATAAGVAGGETRTTFDIVIPFLEFAPVNLLGMAQALALQVNMDAVLSEDVSGSIRKAPNTDRYLIDVNVAHSPRRKRFTLAHEISHFLLHKDQIGDGIEDNALYRSRLGGFMETQANAMAAELLMPAKLLRTLWRAGFRSIHQLSDKFEVSEEALRIRLKQLRLGA